MTCRGVSSPVSPTKSRSAATRSCEWDGRGMRGERVSSGVYYYRLQAGKEIISRTMVLLR